MRNAFEKYRDFNTEKQLALKRFDDGEITAKEYLGRIDSISHDEMTIKEEAMTMLLKNEKLSHNKRWLKICVVAFILGCILGPWVSKKLFGYGSAEECVLDANNRYAAGACYDLYPSVKQ